MKLAADKAFEVFYDGQCPLCRREIGFLRRRDHKRRVVFTDIAESGFDAGSVGRDQRELMARIHGRLPDGSLVEGVEVFRQLYGAVGFRRLVTLSRWPIIAQLLNTAYRLFARYRLRITGRCDEGQCSVSAQP